MKRAVAVVAASVVLLAALAVAVVAWTNRPGPAPASGPGDAARGEYLARVGHCAGCHTARGGAAYAGGRALATPFGTVFSSNLTPDASAGIGRWSGADFQRALREGRSADGRLLVPACPYPNFSRVAPADVDDLFAFLRSLPPVAQPKRPHELRWPYGTQAALAVWRTLFFRPAPPPAERGESLVAGLGHCSACHGARNAWGASAGTLDLGGGAIPAQGWWAPALDDPAEAGVSGWSEDDVVALLKTGRNGHAGVSGPMATVVLGSTQHWRDDDLRAVARFLQTLPQRRAVDAAPPTAPSPEQAALGRRVYEDHCADCHGERGEGAGAVAPALAGNRAVVMARADNLIRVVLGGGFAPATAANPRPFGMPPFATRLSDEEVAAVVTHLRTSWGHRASAVSALAVNRHRGG